jgi:putative transposase
MGEGKGALVAGFKTSATKRFNMLRKTPGAPVWQRNYFEHIIRNEEGLRTDIQFHQIQPILLCGG